MQLCCIAFVSTMEPLLMRKHAMSANTVLILGPRGRFGQAAARAFAAAGWRVLGQTRKGADTPADAAIEWLPIDLYDTAALTQAAQGASVVVHALNPAYTNAAWQTQALAMLDASIALTHALGATLMLPGNIYNFGASMPPVLREGTPQAASTVKGSACASPWKRTFASQSGVRSAS
jgi:nucleoside-diphosphate-sugar epimerase